MSKAKQVCKGCVDELTDEQKRFQARCNDCKGTALFPDMTEKDLYYMEDGKKLPKSPLMVACPDCKKFLMIKDTWEADSKK